MGVYSQCFLCVSLPLLQRDRVIVPKFGSQSLFVHSIQQIDRTVLYHEQCTVCKRMMWIEVAAGDLVCLG